MMKLQYLMVLAVFGNIGVVWGKPHKNSKAVASRFSDDYWNSQGSLRSKRFDPVSVATACGGIAFGITSAVMAAKTLLASHGHKSYSENVEMTVINTSPWRLKDSKIFTKHGQISQIPYRIGPCNGSSIITGHNNKGSVKGTSGIVSWRIKTEKEETERTLIVFWSVEKKGCNSLGLAIYKDLTKEELSEEKQKEIFKDFENKILKEGKSKKKTRKAPNNILEPNSKPFSSEAHKLCHSASEFCINDDGTSFRVCGAISTNSAAAIHVIIDQDDQPDCVDCG